MAISTMAWGLARMVSAWKPNSSTTVASRPRMLTGLRVWTKSSTAFSPPRPLSQRRVSAPATSGSSTYSTVDSTRVSQGTVMSLTPSNSAAMGAKANTMMTSFTDTCTRV